MSAAKSVLLSLKGFNLFVNTNVEVEFSLSKDVKVKASHSYYDPKKSGIDVRSIWIKNEEDPKRSYTRLSLSILVEGRREFFNGALFEAEKKGEKSPDFTGVLNLDSVKDGPKLRLAGWKKTSDKAGRYLSCSIQEYQKGDSKEDSSSSLPEGISSSVEDECPF